VKPSAKSLTSTQNPQFKAAKRLLDAKHRRQAGQFFVEGLREIHQAVTHGFQPLEVYTCESLCKDAAFTLINAITAAHTPKVFSISEAMFGQLALRESGVWVVFAQKSTPLDSLTFPGTPLILALDGIEKPGNLGASLRSCDGAGVDAVVILSEREYDIFNPNTIRSSLGAVFSIPVVVTSPTLFFDFCQKRSIQTVTAALTDTARSYWQIDFRPPTAVILGSEAQGAQPAVLSRTDFCAIIPMAGAQQRIQNERRSATRLFYLFSAASAKSWTFFLCRRVGTARWGSLPKESAGSWSSRRSPSAHSSRGVCL